MKQAAITGRTLLFCVGLGLGGEAIAQESSTHLDLDAVAGYSSNPLLVAGDDAGSGYVRASVRAAHTWTGVRNSGSVTAFVENTSYFRAYDQKLIFDLAAETKHRASEKVTLFGRIGFSGDFAGQLDTRFGPTSIEPPPPGSVPLPVDLTDPDLLGVSGRQFRLHGQMAATISASERSTFDLSFSGEKVFIDSISGGDYANLNASLAFRRQASERLSLGLRMETQYTDYPGSGHAIALRPSVTASTNLSESWELSGAVGISHVKRELPADSSSSTNLFAEGQLCRSGQRARLCARASHSSQNTALLDLVTTSTVSADYSLVIDSKQSVQASLGFVHYGRIAGTSGMGDSDYYTAHASYDRKVSDRLSAGVNVGVRKLDQAGIDRNTDFNGLFYIRYRLGDLL